MSNFNITGSLNFQSLAGGGKQVLLDFIYPIGSYFINDTEAFNTVAKVEAQFGGEWEAIEEGRFIEAVTTPGKGGAHYEAGLPNIAGKFNAASYDDVTNDGAFQLRRNANNVRLGTSGDSRIKEVYFSAALGECGTQKPDSTFSTMSYANNVYGKSTTVQPKAKAAYIYRRKA